LKQGQISLEDAKNFSFNKRDDSIKVQNADLTPLDERSQEG